MTGGLMQLVAYGAQDLYLSGNPQVTFFKAVYRRHTNFSMEYIAQYFEVLPNFSPTQRTFASAKINRNADLIHDMYLVYDVPSVYSTKEQHFQWVENLGENIINYCSITVNGILLDKLYSQWLNVWAQLTIDRSKRRAYDQMIGNTSDMINPRVYNGNYTRTNTKPTINGRRLYIPLPFWFCRNPGLSIPLVALQYTEIYVQIEYKELNSLFTLWYGLSPDAFYEFGKSGNTPTTGVPDIDRALFEEIQNSTNPALTEGVTAESVVNNLESGGVTPLNYFWFFINGTGTIGNWTQNTYLEVNYIYLDVDERRRFAQVTHEYLITQVQSREYTGEQGSTTLEVKINNPVKEIILVTQRNDVYVVNEWNNYTNCLYFRPLYDVNFEKNAYFFKLEKDFISNNIDPCLPSNIAEVSMDPNAFNVNDTNILYTEKLILNGHDRFAVRDHIFFNSLEPYKYHTNSPDQGIYCYSFSINPEDFQPSGTCNFSRINKTEIELKLRTIVNSEVQYNVFLYAININVFRIVGGIGSIVFSN